MTERAGDRHVSKVEGGLHRHGAGSSARPGPEGWNSARWTHKDHRATRSSGPRWSYSPSSVRCRFSSRCSWSCLSQIPCSRHASITTMSSHFPTMRSLHIGRRPPSVQLASSLSLGITFRMACGFIATHEDRRGSGQTHPLRCPGRSPPACPCRGCVNGSTHALGSIPSRAAATTSTSGHHGLKGRCESAVSERVPCRCPRRSHPCRWASPDRPTRRPDRMGPRSAPNRPGDGTRRR